MKCVGSIPLDMAEILEDALIEKGVIVSKTGFTPDAVSFAKYKNISIVELREPTDEDWKGRVKDICIALHIEVPNITDVEIVQPSTSQGTPLKIAALSSDIVFEAQQQRQSLHELIDGELRKFSNRVFLNLIRPILALDGSSISVKAIIVLS